MDSEKPSEGLAPDVLRRRRLAASIYVVALLVVVLLVAWRLVSANA